MRRYHIQDREDYHKCVFVFIPMRRHSPNASGPLRDVTQIQQIVRLAPLFRPSPVAPTCARLLPFQDGRAASVKAL